MIQINKQPSRTDLFVFFALFSFFAGACGVLRHRAGSDELAMACWGAALALPVGALLSRRLARAIYLGWMYATLPLAWTISSVLVAVMFFLVLTPLGIVRTFLGHDPLARRFDRASRSYWIVRPASAGKLKYFRQF